MQGKGFDFARGLGYNTGREGGRAVGERDFYQILLDGLDDGVRVSRIVRGVAWTAAVLEDGRCGVAMRTLGETVPRLRKELPGLGAREAGESVLSWNLEEASEGMAVINAYYNSPGRAAALGVRETSGALEGIPAKGLNVGFIGHMVHHGGATERHLEGAKQLWIMEREPREGDYPDSACETLLPRCDLVVITGSAAVNKTMPRLLELAGGARIVLTGPTVPLCPALLDLGIQRLNGSVVLDGEGLLRQIVRERSSVSAFSRYFTLGE